MYLRKRKTLGKGYKNVNNLFLSVQNLLVKKQTTLTNTTLISFWNIALYIQMN